MLFPLEYVEKCGLYNFIELPLHFFKTIITENEYSDVLFPAWFVPILNKSPKLLKEFEDLANKILEKNTLKRKKIYAVFLNNNRISRLCGNKLYKLKVLDDDLQDVAVSAQKVFSRLYNTTLQGTLVEKEFGESLHDHYIKFRTINASQACPFCGLENYPDRLKNSRSQYDHYLNKSKYCFSSVNFENLIPMCSVCNEAPNKHMKDLLFDIQNGNTRRLVFYPYSNCSGAEVNLINIVPSKVGDGGQWRVDVTPSDNEEQEQVDTWKNVFNIEDRYAARVAEEAEKWIVEFICQSILPNSNDTNTWRAAFQAWAEILSGINELKVVRNGNLKQAYFEYLNRDALEPEIIGIISMAQSDIFAARQIAIGE